MSNPDYSISTPENVDLHLELAGLGNRILACLIDTILTYAIIGAIVFVAWLAFLAVQYSPLSGNVKGIAYGFILMVAMLVAFIVNFGYHIFFEGNWQGQTPGKKVAQIRVIEQNGQPVSWPAVIIRNLIRVFDEGAVLIGILSMIIDKNERRFGDLAAGTLVIRERAPELLTAVPKLDVKTGDMTSAALLDVGRVSPQEYEILVSFLRRRGQMSKSQRPLVAAKLSKHFEERLDEQVSEQDCEQFLERIYTAYQSRADN
ncbi:MAG TPA: RDD family protein [Candidatus Obscuribacterales bacterium]